MSELEHQRRIDVLAIGLFGLVSGLLSLLCHWALEPSVQLHAGDWALVVAMGLGPLGAAFFLWDRALKLGDPRQIGIDRTDRAVRPPQLRCRHAQTLDGQPERCVGAQAGRR